MRKRSLSCAAAAAACAAAWAGPSPFAARVVEYRPAPGQNVNAGAPVSFNDPTKALGAPVGGGTSAPDNSKVVTLGGFGGSITLKFDHTIRHDPCNAFGVDAIVFGNAFWVGQNPARRWAEAAVIEIAKDVNGAPGPWFVIAGSSLPGAPGVVGAPASVASSQQWDLAAGTGFPPANKGWYPQAPAFPGWPSTYTTSGFVLPGVFAALPVVNPSGLPSGAQGYWGYADMSPTLLLGDMSGAAGAAGVDNRLDQPEDRPGIDPAQFYTSPSDPRALAIAPGSGGGDAFAIAWAVDPATGAPANLDGFDYIRISTGVNAVLAGGLGEMSAEIGGVAEVRSWRAGFPRGDANRDGVVDFRDLNLVLSQYGLMSGGGLPGGCGRDCLEADLDCDGAVGFADLNAVLSNYGGTAP